MIKKFINNIKIKLIKMLGGYVYSPPKIIRVTPEIVTLSAEIDKDFCNGMSEGDIRDILAKELLNGIKPTIEISEEHYDCINRMVYRTTLRLLKE